MSSTTVIPYSPGLPVLGHLLAYQNDRLKLLEDLRYSKGSRFRLKIGSKKILVLTSPEDVRHIMQTNMKNYYKRTNFDQLFGNGLFTTNDREWKNQRKLVQPLFGPRYIESCAPIILESGQNCLSEYLQGPQEDIYSFFAKATFEIIIKTIIGVDYSDRFEEMNFALNYVSDYLTKANYLPFELPEKLNPGKREYERCRKLLDEIIYESIEEQRSKEKRKDSSMISLLLQAREEDPEFEYNNQRVRDNIITLMFAGFETSALSLSWIACLLAERPKLQEELYLEIKDMPLEQMKVKDFASYPVLDAVVNEALRLYPPGWAWTRVAREDDNVNGCPVGAGEIVFISPYLTQRAPEVWDRPKEFDHTRFLNAAPNKFAPFAYFPFGGGPRICVGKQFGTIEIKLLLAQLMKENKFTDGKVPYPEPMATLRGRGGFKVSLEPRT